MNPSDEQQRIELRRSLETDFISSTRHFIVSNVNSIDEQTQNIRKLHRHHRSSSKNNLQTPKPLQLLPQFWLENVFIFRFQINDIHNIYFE